MVERQTAGATHTRTPVDKRRESEVCESVSELDEFDGERLSQLGERVCEVRLRGAPEKKLSTPHAKDAMPRASKFACVEKKFGL